MYNHCCIGKGLYYLDSAMKKTDLIITYGKEILESPYFIQAKGQTHHLRTDVASHSINTAFFCIAFYNILKRLNIKINIAVLIVAALSHDLGILGRSEKFTRFGECLSTHPSLSVITVREIIPEIDTEVCDAISSHMFPFSRKLPSTNEAWLLSIADKCAAVTDFFFHYSIPEI